jgi:hypothetical protein
MVTYASTRYVKLHNKELRDLYSSSSITRTIKLRSTRLAGHVARMGKKMDAYRLLMGKQEGKRHLGRPRWRKMDNQVPQNAGKLSSGLSSGAQLHRVRVITRYACL